MKWPVETIDVVAQVNPKLAATDRPDLDEIVCFVPMAAVSEETLSIKAQAERPFSEVAKGYTPFKRGDVLVAKITPCFENGKMALADNLAHELGFGTTEFHVFRPSERITGPYLFNLLRAPYVRKAGAMKMKGAAGQRRVPADFFAALQVPLPPLAEQKRIAGILDAADALRTKRREALAQLDTLLQSTFLDMFGDPVTNPMGWKTPALSEVTDEIYRYPTYFGIVYENEGVPEIRGELIGKGGKLDTDPSKLRFIAQATSDKFPRTQLAAGDLVMSVRGTIGKIGIVPAELINANMTANLIRISSARSIIDPVFLLHLALGPYFLDQLSRASSSTTIKTIKSLDLKAIPIPLPPLDLQRRFAAIVESFEHQKASQRAHLAELDTLFASLQSRAFRGDL